MSELKEKAERTITALEGRILQAQSYIERVETMVFAVPVQAPTVGTALHDELTDRFEKIMKLYLTMLDTSRKLMLISQEERQRENMETDELYYYLKGLPKDDIQLLRAFMDQKIRERVVARSS